jgi:hypothetical protein
MITRTYIVKLELDAATGLLGKGYVGSILEGNLFVSASQDFFRTMTGECFVEGKILSVVDKKGKPIVQDRLSGFGKRAIPVSGGAFIFEKKDKNFTATFSGQISPDGNTIENILVSAKASKLYSFLADNISASGSGEKVSDSIDLPEPIPPTAPNSFSTKLLWTSPKNIKGSGLAVDKSGRILEVRYDNVSRRDSWVYANGSKIATMKAETGNIFFTNDNRTWISTEAGQKSSSGIKNPCELIGNSMRPLAVDVHFCGCGIAIGKTPYFLDIPNNGDDIPKAKDEDGKVFAKFKGKGIPYSAVIDPENNELIVTVLQDGANGGISWSNFKDFIPCTAHGIVVRKNKILVGTGGYLKLIEDKKLVDFAPVTSKLADSIDSMDIDSYGNTWISTSSPDALYVLTPQDRLIKVDSKEDGNDGGSLFRTRVATNGIKTVWGRNNKNNGNSWEVREVIYKTQEPTQPPATSKEPIDVSKVKWLGRGAENFPVVSKATGKIDDLVRMTLEKAIGKSCWLGIIILRDGVYYGGAVDGVGDNPTSINKSKGNITGGDKNGPLIARFGPKSDEASSRAYLRLKKGETFWVYVQSDTPKARTEVVQVVWNEGSSDNQEPPTEKPTEPEKVNKGGDGLYKPETRLWLLPKGPKAPNIRYAAEYRPGGILVKNLRIGTNSGERADGKQSAKDHPDFYHNGRLVFRDSVVSANGNSLIAWTKTGQKFMMTVKERLVRQEGKS